MRNHHGERPKRSSGAPTSAGEVMSDSKLNHKVYLFAHSHTGQYVGNKRQCWDLADRALDYAGAASSSTTGDYDDYVWGTPVGVHQVTAGDILQFRNHVITTTTTTNVTFDDGSGYERTQEKAEQRPHHTAIVAAYKGPTSVLVIEQNYPEGDRVRQHTLALSSVAPVSTTSYRSMKDDQGKMRHAKVVVIVEIEVTGQMWAYRPKAKS